MGWKKIGRGLAKIAPVAAKVATSSLLGPGVVGQITDALGLGKDASEDEVEQALATASPEQLVRIREINAETERHAADVGLKEKELEVRREETHQKDRESARQREIAVRDATPRMFAWIALCGFLGLVYLVAIVGVHESSENLIYAALGTLGSVLLAACHYFYGSSAGSKNKDDTIHRALHK